MPLSPKGELDLLIYNLFQKSLQPAGCSLVYLEEGAFKL